MTDSPGRMTTREVLESLERERDALLAAVDALGKEATTAAVTDEGWTAHDVLGHLIHWAGQVAVGLGAPVQPPAYLEAVEGRPSGEEWNAIAVAFHRSRAFEDVRTEFVATTDAIIERVRDLSDDEMNETGAIRWAPERVLWRFVGGDTFLHWPAHRADIERTLAARA